MHPSEFILVVVYISGVSSSDYATVWIYVHVGQVLKSSGMKLIYGRWCSIFVIPEYKTIALGLRQSSLLHLSFINQKGLVHRDLCTYVTYCQMEDIQNAWFFCFYSFWKIFSECFRIEQTELLLNV